MEGGTSMPPCANSSHLNGPAVPPPVAHGYLSIHVTHRGTPLDALEALTEARTRSFTAHLLAEFPWAEAIPLRTCNRFETYISVPEAEGARVLAWARRRRLASGQFLKQGRDSVEHLFRVAAGLDSQLLGEQEILGQVREAYLTAKEAGWAGPRLSRLFERAIFVGRKVREETGLSQGGRSLARLAVDEVRRVHPELSSLRVGVLGAGKMGEKVTRRLRAEGTRMVTVGVRNRERRLEVARRWGVRAVSPPTLLRHLDGLDILFCAANSGKPVVRITRGRPIGEAPLTVVDLGNPRNVEATGPVHGVRIIDLEGLREAALKASQERAGLVPAAAALVARECQRFEAEEDQGEVAAFAQKLLTGAETVAREMRGEALARLRGPTPPERVLEDFGHALVRRLLTPSITRLKETRGAERARLLAAAERLLPLVSHGS